MCGGGGVLFIQCMNLRHPREVLKPSMKIIVKKIVHIHTYTSFYNVLIIHFKSYWNHLYNCRTLYSYRSNWLCSQCLYSSKLPKHKSIITTTINCNAVLKIILIMYIMPYECRLWMYSFYAFKESVIYCIYI